MDRDIYIYAGVKGRVGRKLSLSDKITTFLLHVVYHDYLTDRKHFEQSNAH